MTARIVLEWPDKRLLLPCQRIPNPKHEAATTLIEDLFDTMRLYGGVGIAAPQIGVNLQAFVISGEITEDGLDKAFINPEIFWQSEEVNKDFEGCLSFPDIFLKIERPIKVGMESYDITGEKFKFEAEGFLARAVQHELDHLNGKLFINLVGSLQRNMVKKKLKKRRKK